MRIHAHAAAPLIVQPPSNQPRWFSSLPTDGHKANLKALMSQPRPHRTVSPYRTHSHHSMMKGDHPPIFGFQQMQAIITTAEAPMDGSVLKASKTLWSYT